MHTQARVHTRVMRVGSGELQGKAHLPAQPSSHNPAPRSQLRHLQVCAESQHRPESLQEKSCLWRGLVNCVLDVLGHFISLQSKGRIRTLCTPVPAPSPSQVKWGLHVHGLEAWVRPWDIHTGTHTPGFSLCCWRGSQVPGVGIFTVSWALPAGT